MPGLSLATILLLFSLMAYFYFFIGAYLYEKISGKEMIQKGKQKKMKNLEEIEETPELFGRMRIWSRKRDGIKDKEEKRREQELMKPSSELKSLYASMKMLDEAADKKDFENLDKFYIKAKDIYMKLNNAEQRQVYSKLMQLYKIRNNLVEEKRKEDEKLQEKQKEAERKRIEAEIKKKAAAREEKKDAGGKRSGIMHVIGV